MPRKPKPEGQHVAIYARVSHASQDTRSQEPDLKRWAEAQGLPVVWYRDKASGGTMDRPGWNKIDAEIRAGNIAAVVVWRLDRLGRTASGLTKLFEELHATGVNLVSLKDGLDLGTSAGRLMANVLASVAQYEREVRGERQRAGIDAALAKGVKFGRPRANDARPAKRIKVTAEAEEQIRRLDAEGRPKAEIARATGLSRPTVYRVLAQPG